MLDWLVLTGQSVLEVIAGPVFAGQASELAQVRAVLRWYPPGIERYVLAAGWQRLCGVEASTRAQAPPRYACWCRGGAVTDGWLQVEG